MFVSSRISFQFCSWTKKEQVMQHIWHNQWECSYQGGGGVSTSWRYKYSKNSEGKCQIFTRRELSSTSDKSECHNPKLKVPRSNWIPKPYSENWIWTRAGHIQAFKTLYAILVFESIHYSLDIIERKICLTFIFRIELTTQWPGKYYLAFCRNHPKKFQSQRISTVITVTSVPCFTMTTLLKSVEVVMTSHRVIKIVMRTKTQSSGWWWITSSYSSCSPWWGCSHL